MPGATLGTGPADKERAGSALPSKSYHFRNYSFNHRAGNSQRRALSGILPWAEKNFSCLGSRKVDSCPHRKRTHGSGMQISKMGRGTVQVGSPGVRSDQKPKTQSPGTITGCQHCP